MVVKRRRRLKEDMRGNWGLEVGLTEILDRISDWFYALDPEWRIMYANKQMRDLWGKEEHELRGRNIWEVFPQAVGTIIDEQLHQAMETQQCVKFEWVSTVLNRWVEVTAYPSESGLSIFLHDISERKFIDERKDEFIGMASHELRTPVTSIKVYAQMLARLTEGAQPKLYETVLKMDVQISKLTKLILDLLDVSKANQGSLEYEKEAVDIDDLVREVAETVQSTAAGHRIRVKGKTGAMVEGDRHRLCQVLVNILNNAVKYSPHAPQIDVRLEKVDDQAVIMVRDRGMGIPMSLQSRVFERFYRGDHGVRRSPIPGLGIGLYICKQIVEHHGGEIGFVSMHGKGTTFEVRLPVRDGDKAKE